MIERGVSRANLMWENTTVQSQVVGVLDTIPWTWFRDGIREVSTASDYAVVRKSIQDLGYKQLVIASLQPADWDDPTEASQKLLSTINLTKYETRLRAHLDALQSEGVIVDAFELGNELDYNLFNGDIPDTGLVEDASLLPHAQAYARWIDRIVPVFKEYYPSATIIGYGIANFRGQATNGFIQNPGVLFNLLRDIDGTNYLGLMDALAVHIYPNIVSDNIPSMIYTRLQKFVDDVGTTKKVWITEWGSLGNEPSPPPNRSRYRVFAEIARTLWSMPNIVENIFYHGLDDFSIGLKWIVDETTYDLLPEAYFFIDSVGIGNMRNWSVPTLAPAPSRPSSDYALIDQIPTTLTPCDSFPITASPDVILEFEIPSEHKGDGTLKIDIICCANTTTAADKARLDVATEFRTPGDAVALNANNFDSSLDNGVVTFSTTAYAPRLLTITLTPTVVPIAGDKARVRITRDQTTNSSDDDLAVPLLVLSYTVYEEANG